MAQAALLGTSLAGARQEQRHAGCARGELSVCCLRGSQTAPEVVADANDASKEARNSQGRALGRIIAKVRCFLAFRHPLSACQCCAAGRVNDLVETPFFKLGPRCERLKDGRGTGVWMVSLKWRVVAFARFPSPGVAQCNRYVWNKSFRVPVGAGVRRFHAWAELQHSLGLFPVGTLAI